MSGYGYRNDDGGVHPGDPIGWVELHGELYVKTVPNVWSKYDWMGQPWILHASPGFIRMLDRLLEAKYGH
jgi:hypothetical protein